MMYLSSNPSSAFTMTSFSLLRLPYRESILIGPLVTLSLSAHLDGYIGTHATAGVGKARKSIPWCRQTRFPAENNSRFLENTKEW